MNNTDLTKNGSELNTGGTSQYATNTNNVKKTSVILQTSRGKTEPKIALCGDRSRHHKTKSNCIENA